MPRTHTWQYFLHTLSVLAGASAWILLLGGFLSNAQASQAQPTDTSQIILAIQQAIQSGDLERASREVADALNQHPHDGGLVNLRGIVHAQRNQIQQAHKDFAEAVRFAPALTAAWQNLARTCQLEAKSVSCAIDSWQHVLKLKTGDQEAIGSLSLLYEREGKYTQSLAESEKLSGEEAKRTVTLFVRCADLCALGHPGEAETVASELASRADFSGSDFEAFGKALESPQSAAVVMTLVEGLDRRKAASTESLRRLAIAYEQLQRPADARKTLERVAVAEPANTAHLLELARLADAAKDYQGALGYLAHARDLKPNDAQIHFLFADVAMEMDLVMQARESLGEALKLDPNNPAYNYAMGFVTLQTHDAASAASYFQKFVAAHPEDAKGHYALGIAYYASGDYAKCKAEMHRVENDPKTAGGPDYFLGRMARQEGDLDGAAQHLRKSIQLMPDFSESHTELARICMEKGDLARARAELDRAVQLDPQSFEANMQLLVVYRRTHNSRAVAQAEVVKKLDANRSKRAELALRTVEARPIVSSPEADSFVRAMSLVKSGDDDKARSILADLSAKYPKKPIYIYWLGRLDYDQRRYQEAIAKLRKAAELDPQSARIQDSLGNALDMQGLMDQALATFQHSVELNRNDPHPSPWPPHDLGYLLLRLEKFGEAEAALRESLRYDPKLAQTHYYLGRTLEKEGRDQGAIEEYKEAIAGDKGSADSCYSLAMLYRKLHREADAAAMFAEYKTRKQAHL